MPGGIRRVGFVGVGNMGWPMAANLLKAGFDVAVCDAAPARAAQFASEVGGRAAHGRFGPCSGNSDRRDARSARATPRSVMMPVTSRAGVTSKAGFAAGLPGAET